MSTFVDNDGLRIEVLFSGNGVRAVSSQWATQGRVLHNGSLSLFGITGERSADGRIAWSNGASWRPLAATPFGPFSPSDAPARSHTWVQVARYPNLGYAEGQGYGCWFARDPSSRMWVRAGRVKVFADQFGNKTLEREGCRDLEQCRTHWAARRASVVETLAREPPLSDRGVYA